MRVGISYVVFMFSLLLSACANNPVSNLFSTDAAQDTSAEAVQEEYSPEASSSQGNQPASQPSAAKSIEGHAAVKQDAKPVADAPVPQFSALGKERAKLLAEMNKSLTVKLPPVAFLDQLDAGSARVENLTLFDAMALALEYSNEVAASSAHRDTTDYLATASLGPLLPRVDVRYNTGQETSNPSSVTQLPYYDRKATDTHTRTDSQIFVRQTLMDLPSYFERQRQNLLLQAAEHNLSNTQERVAYDTLVSFMNLIQLRLTVVMVESYETDLKKLLDYMTTRVKAGGATKADMQRVKGRVLNTTSAVIEARGAYESGLVEFKRLTGVVPSSIVIPEKLLPVLPDNFNDAMAEAIRNNFELQAALRDVDSVAQERHAIKGKYAPKFDIEISAMRTYNAGGVAASDPIPNSTLYTVQNDRRAMFVMSWNLLNGGSDFMQDKALESKRLEYEYRAKEIQRRLEESLRINFNALRAVNGRIGGVRQEMESNDIVLAAFNEQLFAANRSLLDVLDAYQRQYNSRTELTRLLVSEATAGLQMLRNIGKLQEGIVALH